MGEKNARIVAVRQNLSIGTHQLFCAVISLILSAVVPEKLTADPANYFRIFFGQPNLAEELADIVHPVEIIGVFEKIDSGQNLLEMIVHAFEFKG